MQQRVQKEVQKGGRPVLVCTMVGAARESFDNRSKSVRGCCETMLLSTQIAALVENNRNESISPYA